MEIRNAIPNYTAEYMKSQIFRLDLDGLVTSDKVVDAIMGDLHGGLRISSRAGRPLYLSGQARLDAEQYGIAWQVESRSELARQCRNGQAKHGRAGRGVDWQARTGQALRAMARPARSE